MQLIYINDSNYTSEQLKALPNRPKVNEVVESRDIFKTRNGTGVHLKKYRNPIIGYPTLENAQFTFEPSFNANRFTTLLGKPITAEKIKTEIEI